MSSTIDKNRLPRHIAVIMDGNGRWAKKQGEMRTFGHKQGVTAVRETTETAARLGIDCLTLYAFSTENWNRPQEEVQVLMELLVTAIQEQTPMLMDNNVRLQVIGDWGRLYPESRERLSASIERTSKNSGLTLVLALSYSSRSEIVYAVRQIGEEVRDGKLLIEDIDEKTISSRLYTSDYPDPDLLIRTGGEQRISNFLMWQIAYAELYFTDLYWPEFNASALEEAIVWYQQRERRYGKISEQLTPSRV